MMMHYSLAVAFSIALFVMVCDGCVTVPGGLSRPLAC
jgi:hypothetical protein